MLSQTAEYALRAVLYIGSRGEEARVRVGEIAESLDVPQNYLSKILNVLAREGVLDSMRGPHGGFSVAGSADQLTLARVIQPFDPIEENPQCLLMRRPCSDADPCIAHGEWKSIAVQVRGFFRRTTIGALLEDADARTEILGI